MSSELERIFKRAERELASGAGVAHNDKHQEIAAILGGIKASVSAEIVGSTTLALHELARIGSWIDSNSRQLDVYSATYLKNATLSIQSELESLLDFCESYDSKEDSGPMPSS